MGNEYTAIQQIQNYLDATRQHQHAPPTDTNTNNTVQPSSSSSTLTQLRDVGQLLYNNMNNNNNGSNTRTNNNNPHNNDVYDAYNSVPPVPTPTRHIHQQSKHYSTNSHHNNKPPVSAPQMKYKPAQQNNTISNDQSLQQLLVTGSHLTEHDINVNTSQHNSLMVTLSRMHDTQPQLDQRHSSSSTTTHSINNDTSNHLTELYTISPVAQQSTTPHDQPFKPTQPVFISNSHNNNILYGAINSNQSSVQQHALSRLASVSSDRYQQYYQQRILQERQSLNNNELNISSTGNNNVLPHPTQPNTINLIPQQPHLSDFITDSYPAYTTATTNMPQSMSLFTSISYDLNNHTYRQLPTTNNTTNILQAVQYSIPITTATAVPVPIVDHRINNHNQSTNPIDTANDALPHDQSIHILYDQATLDPSDERFICTWCGKSGVIGGSKLCRRSDQETIKRPARPRWAYYNNERIRVCNSCGIYYGRNKRLPLQNHHSSNSNVHVKHEIHSPKPHSRMIDSSSTNTTNSNNNNRKRLHRDTDDNSNIPNSPNTIDSHHTVPQPQHTKFDDPTGVDHTVPHDSILSDHSSSSEQHNTNIHNTQQLRISLNKSISSTSNDTTTSSSINQINTPPHRRHSIDNSVSDAELDLFAQVIRESLHDRHAVKTLLLCGCLTDYHNNTRNKSNDNKSSWLPTAHISSSSQSNHTNNDCGNNSNINNNSLSNNGNGTDSIIYNSNDRLTSLLPRIHTSTTPGLDSLPTTPMPGTNTNQHTFTLTSPLFNATPTQSFTIHDTHHTNRIQLPIIPRAPLQLHQ